MRWNMLMVLAVAACGSKRSGDDCKVVLADPPKAMVAITEKYPGQPIKVAEVIERCVAPSGDECERVARVIAAIPSMAPGTKAPSGDVLELCKGMPPEMRRCMLPSYALGHADECTKTYEKIAEVAAEPTGQTAGPSACEPFGLSITTAGVWLSTKPDGTCFGVRQGAALDTGWIEARLREAVVPACKPALTISGSADVKYEEVIQVMDLATKVGILEISLGTADELPVKFDGDPRQAAKTCPPPIVAATPPASAPPPPTAAGSAALANAPVVVVTRDELLVSGTAIARTSELAKGSGKIDALVERLPPDPTDHTVIVQADQDTNMTVMVRVIDTLKSAGYDNVLFAVKNK